MGWATSPSRKQETLFTLPILQMGARVYLPSIGRFLQPDPIPGGTPNGYTYVLDPINLNDYTGRCALQCPVGVSVLQPAAGAPVIQQANVTNAQLRTARISVRATSPAAVRRSTTVSQELPKVEVNASYLANLKKDYEQAQAPWYASSSKGRFDFVSAIDTADEYYKMGWIAGGGFGCVIGAGITFLEGGWGCLPVGGALGGFVGTITGTIGFVVGGIGAESSELFTTGQPDGPEPLEWLK